MKRRIVALTLAAVCSLTALAGCGNTQGLSEQCVRDVETIFDEDSGALIRDAQGNDVTEAFRAANRESYRSGDDSAVLDDLIRNNYALEEPCGDNLSQMGESVKD